MLLYNLVVQAYGLMIRLASTRRTKAAQWIRGRKNWREVLKDRVKYTIGAPLIWVHCASYGEFEQGRPLIEKLKTRYPRHRILLSFFSPSGYEAFKDWPGADIICYLPLDSRKNARDFLDIVKPEMTVFIKYEFWLHYLRELRNRKTPTYLVSAVFKPHHPFFKWYGSIFRRSLHTFTRLFIQDAPSGQLLNTIGVTNHEVCGDTRFDRVLEIRRHFTEIPELAAFKGTGRLLVAGSTWPKDEELVIDAFLRLDDPGLKLLLAPHNIEKKPIRQTVERLTERGLSHSVFTEGVDVNNRVLVLDTMGMLSRSYHYSNAAYIGGGFNGGLHNCLEAAVYGVPVFFFGDDYAKFNEVVELLQRGAAIKVNSGTGMAEELGKLLGDLARLQAIQKDLEIYFSQNADSTGKILRAMEIPAY